jgi:hypothetical protein
MARLARVVVPGVVSDVEPRAFRRSGAARGLAFAWHRPGAPAFRGVVERPPRLAGPPVGKPVLLDAPGRNAPVESRPICGAQPGAGQPCCPRGGVALVFGAFPGGGLPGPVAGSGLAGAAKAGGLERVACGARRRGTGKAPAPLHTDRPSVWIPRFRHGFPLFSFQPRKTRNTRKGLGARRSSFLFVRFVCFVVSAARVYRAIRTISAMG